MFGNLSYFSRPDVGNKKKQKSFTHDIKILVVRLTKSISTGGDNPKKIHYQQIE
jgi:hypothetical protein